jgi:hypothetical protein
MKYDYDKIRENYHSLAEIKNVFADAAVRTGAVEGTLVQEYEAFLDKASSDIPNLLNSFDKQQYFSHDNGHRNVYYKPDGIRAHIGRNLSILKVKMDNTDASPIVESRSFLFMDSGKLRSIMERDYQEIQRNTISGNWKSTIILCGGSIEAILLDLLTKHEATAIESTKAPGGKDLNDWVLNDLIDVALDTRLVESNVATLSHSVREYRNLIHPGFEVRKQLKIEPEEAKIAVQVLNILIRELSR